MRINNILKRGVGGVGIFGVGAPYPQESAPKVCQAFSATIFLKKLSKKGCAGMNSLIIFVR